MPGPDNLKVTMVKCCDLLLTETFSNCDNRGVDETERQIRVLSAKLLDPRIVSTNEVGNPDSSILHILEKRCKCVRTKSSVG